MLIIIDASVEDFVKWYGGGISQTLIEVIRVNHQ
jgi:hypothetical protein